LFHPWSFAAGVAKDLMTGAERSTLTRTDRVLLAVARAVDAPERQDVVALGLDVDVPPC
jgi:hypothetical protein